FARKHNLENKRDYSLYRFIDDYFLFANNEETIEIIENCLKVELDKYNLNLNTTKRILQRKPFAINDNSILSLKRVIKEFEFEKMLSSLKAEIDYEIYKGKEIHWNDLFFKVENLISKYPSSKTNIVNYFLKTILSSIFFDEKYKYKFVIANILYIVSNIFTLYIISKSTTYLISI